MEVDKKGKTRFVCFILFLLLICSFGNGYIDIARQIDTGWEEAGTLTVDGADMTLLANIVKSGFGAAMYFAWFLGTLIGNLVAALLFKLVAVRKFDVVSKQELTYSLFALAAIALGFSLYGIIATHHVLFPLCVNAGHLVAFALVYILNLYMHRQEKIQQKILQK